MAAYLEAFIQDADGDALFIAKAMEDIAGAKGMTQIARETGLSSERLYKAMSVEKSPHFDTVLKVISALGLTLSASVKGAERAELVLLANLRFADVSNWKRPFEQAPGVDRPPPSLCFATPASLPATQGQRWVNKALKEMAYVLLSRYHPKSTENQRISNQALAPGAKDSL